MHGVAVQQCTSHRALTITTRCCQASIKQAPHRDQQRRRRPPHGLCCGKPRIKRCCCVWLVPSPFLRNLPTLSLATPETQEVARRIIESSLRKREWAANFKTKLDLRRRLLIAFTERHARLVLWRSAARAPSPPHNSHQSFSHESRYDSTQLQRPDIRDIAELAITS
ncbi:unnamed protein product [Mesocestoides corti]|uniref:Uncharacterized protein n=1 Tax=Mesocestoides corti TaxID=53468 RepID=A0A0R3UR94_MESCO|nr:unnamed protein product [Mesocestoides corti]